MVRGDKNPLAEVSSPAAGDEGEEIDRIMKEIEDLEKKMDSDTDSDSESEKPKSQAQQQESEPAAKVVALRPEASESMAETDAVPVSDEPLVRSTTGAGDGGLALKIGGCTEVSLEFTRSGMTVSLSCSDEGLCITTDQGAEFRIPFKRSA